MGKENKEYKIVDGPSKLDLFLGAGLSDQHHRVEFSVSMTGSEKANHCINSDFRLMLVSRCSDRETWSFVGYVGHAGEFGEQYFLGKYSTQTRKGMLRVLESSELAVLRDFFGTLTA